MRSVITLTVCTLLYLGAQAQTSNLYTFIQYTGGGYGLASIDPQNGQITPISGTPAFIGGTSPSSAPAIDADNNRLFLYEFNFTTANQRLLTIDLTTGAVINAANVSGQFNTLRLDYNCATGILYTLIQGPGSFQLASIDPATGTVTSLIPGGIGISTLSIDDKSTIDPVTNRYYILNTSPGQPPRLITIDLNTNTIISNQQLVGNFGGRLTQLNYNCVDEQVYAFNELNATARFMRTLPNTVTPNASINPASNFTGFPSSASSNKSAVDPFLHRGYAYYLAGANRRIVTFDLTTGAILNDALVGPGISQHRFLVFATPCSAPLAGFTYSDTCSGGSTSFEGLSSGGSWQWDFGDGSTGIGRQIQHTYANPGSYTVRLVSQTCSGSDTLTRTLTIEPQPTADLGADTLLCSGDVLVLDPDPTAQNVQWNTGATQSQLSVTQQGTYSVTVSNGGCTAEDSITVSYLQRPFVQLGNDTVICDPGAFILDAGNPGATYQWSTGQTTPSITIDSAGVYYVTVTNGICTVIDSISVAIQITATLPPGETVQFCPKGQAQLGTVIPNATYSWSTGETTSQISVAQPGNYTVTVTLGLCPRVQTWTASYVMPPTTLPPSRLLCIGQDWEPELNYPNQTVVWMDTIFSPSITITDSGQYYFAVIDPICTYRDTIAVSLLDPSIDLGTFPPKCPSEPITLEVPSGATYTWNTGDSVSSITVREPGIYAVTLTADGCEAIDSTELTNLDIPILTLPEQIETCDSEVILTSPIAEPGNLLWDTGDTTVSITATRSGEYALTYTYCNVVQTDTIQVTLLPEGGQRFYLPNAFTPNGDGLNDEFRIVGNVAVARDFELSVFNRWGGLVFQSFNPDQGWDGSYQGQIQEGVYVYRCEVINRCLQDVQVLTGSILLLLRD